MFEYNTGLKDLYGDPLINLVPTCVIIDSLAIMRSGEIDFSTDPDKTTNNMAKLLVHLENFPTCIIC